VTIAGTAVVITGEGAVIEATTGGRAMTTSIETGTAASGGPIL
jgi:hypothetical protein